MKKTIFAGTALLALVLMVSLAPHFGTAANAKPPQGVSPRAGQVPILVVDPKWPKPMPNGWVFGQVAAVTVDKDDNVWVLHRFRSVDTDKFKAAPPVVEFDKDGNFIQAWGGTNGPGYEWPGSEHGLFVDYKGFVWVGGECMTCTNVMKFTKDGKFVMQIGKPGQKGSMTDTQHMVGPTDMFVYPKTNEVFVGDTGDHGRIMVFDADSGAFKRMWGGHGNPPAEPGPDEHVNQPPNGGGRYAGKDVEDGGDPPQLTEAHRVRVSNDGLVYVSDGPNKRFQVFTIAGKYVDQRFVSRDRPADADVPVVHTRGMGMEPAWGAAFTPVAKQQMITHHESASGVALSSDPQQMYLYVYDRSRSKIQIYDRKSLTLIGEFAEGPGKAPGQLYIPHDIRADSQGNVYIAEVNIGARVQKFVLKGYMTPLKPKS